MYTYELYGKNDQSNDLYNRARKNHRLEGQDCFFILHKGVPSVVQGERLMLKDHPTLEAAAEAMIAEMEAQEGGGADAAV